MYIPKHTQKHKQSSTKLPRVETLSEKQIISLTQNHLLVSVMSNGRKTKEALELVRRQYPGFKRSVRWAQKLFKEFKKRGVQALFDGRLNNQNQKEVLTPEVERIALEWWYGRPAAGPKEIWRKTVIECRKRRLSEPCYQSVQKFLASQSEANKLVRAGKITTWDKQGRPVVRYNLTHYCNQRWQIDHTRLDIWVRQWVKDRWVVREVWLTVVLDAHSRSIAGFILSLKTPDAWTTALLLRKAILPKENKDWLNRGLPSVLQPDRGSDFMSHAVQASVARVDIIFDPDPPYYPNRKGKIERFFLTLDHYLRILSGHHKAIGKSYAAAQKHLAVLLTREQLQTEIENWIVKEYHQRENSETKRKPAELWEEKVQLRMPESEELLDSFLLKSDKVRVIRNTGIDFHIAGKGNDRGGRYWAPEMAWFYKREVTVSYNPEDLDSILIYCASTREFIGEAWLMGDKHSKYSVEDVKRARCQARRGLLERMKMYSAEVHAQDRRAVKHENWKKARENAKNSSQAPAPAKTKASPESNLLPASSDRMARVEALLNKFENKDRGNFYE